VPPCNVEDDAGEALAMPLMRPVGGRRGARGRVGLEPCRRPTRSLADVAEGAEAVVRFCPGAEGGRIADVVFELGAGKAFVANHYLPGREGAFDSAATARSSALSGASSTPTGSPSGDLWTRAALARQ